MVGTEHEWTPEVPLITNGRGKDRRARTYIIAAFECDIVAICAAAGIPSEGIREGTWYNGYERIVKEHEKDAMRAVFPWE